jgi:hypothetical protein
VKCVQCARAFAPGEKARAAISIFAMGDEYIYSYWLCDACGYYTVESYHDRFLGEDEITFLPPVPREVGDRCVELVRACPRPFDKNCECASHQALYHGLPPLSGGPGQRV